MRVKVEPRPRLGMTVKDRILRRVQAPQLFSSPHSALPQDSLDSSVSTASSTKAKGKAKAKGFKATRAAPSATMAKGGKAKGGKKARKAEVEEEDDGKVMTSRRRKQIARGVR